MVIILFSKKICVAIIPEMSWKEITNKKEKRSFFKYPMKYSHSEVYVRKSQFYFTILDKEQVFGFSWENSIFTIQFLLFVKTMETITYIMSQY